MGSVVHEEPQVTKKGPRSAQFEAETDCCYSNNVYASVSMVFQDHGIWRNTANAPPCDLKKIPADRTHENATPAQTLENFPRRPRLSSSSCSLTTPQAVESDSRVEELATIGYNSGINKKLPANWCLAPAEESYAPRVPTTELEEATQRATTHRKYLIVTPM